MTDRDKKKLFNAYAESIDLDSYKPKSRLLGGDGRVEEEFPIYVGDTPLDINGAPIKDRKVRTLLLDGKY